MDMVSKNTELDTVKETGKFINELGDFDCDKRLDHFNKDSNISEKNSNGLYDPDKPVDINPKDVNSYDEIRTGDIDLDKRISFEATDETVRHDEISTPNVKVLDNGIELNQQQKNELIDKGMSPGIVGDCTYKDGVYHLKTPYNKFEGRMFGDTGVMYLRKTIDFFGTKIEGVFPKFESVFTAQLSNEKLKSSDHSQFTECTKQLQNAIMEDPSLKSKFSSRQLEQIKNGKTPGGYVWHHNEEVGKMELVKYDIHDAAKHYGGRAIWGGGSLAR